MDNRQSLLKCALDMFAARGYETVGVQEIVEAAGVTKPTLYHYFGSKKGLLVALLDEHFNELYSQLQEATSYHGDLTRSLTRTTQASFDFARQHKAYYRFQLALWFAPLKSEAFEAVRDLHQKQTLLVEDLFRRAANDHGNMRGRHQAYAATFWGMVNTYLSLWLNDLVELNDERVYQVVHQFEHGIYS